MQSKNSFLMSYCLYSVVRVTSAVATASDTLLVGEEVGVLMGLVVELDLTMSAYVGDWLGKLTLASSLLLPSSSVVF
eukprot:14282691-Ditylum_brightwellii.AAC.1